MPRTMEVERLEARGRELLQNGDVEQAAGCFMAAVNAEVRDNSIDAELARWADDGGPSYGD